MLLGSFSLAGSLADSLAGTGGTAAAAAAEGIATVAAEALADEAESTAAKPYPPSENPMADVNAAIARAGAAGKLALIVLGANWCHDSIGLADHFAAPAMVALLDGRYETQFVDVGLFEHGADIIRRFGMPVIYGTPTVLIIDPASERLVNAGNMHQWRDAASISAEDTLAYFMAMADSGANPGAQASAAMPADPAALAALTAGIDAFEAAQARRIYRGYDFLRPLMAKDKADRPDAFMGYWEQLSDLRYSVTGDLARLRAEARARVLAGETDIRLVYPEYAKFSWE